MGGGETGHPYQSYLCKGTGATNNVETYMIEGEVRWITRVKPMQGGWIWLYAFRQAAFPDEDHFTSVEDS